jgi:hypothetical protein
MAKEVIRLDKKQYESRLKKTAKETLGVGVTVVGGSMILGAMGNLPGMHAGGKAVGGIAQAGLGLVALGQAAKVAMALVPETKKKPLRWSTISKGW